MAVTELWRTLEQAIKEYTGLSPTIFFTFVAVAVAFYFVVSSYFERPPVQRKRETFMEPAEPLSPPVQLGEITDVELSAYDGSDRKKPLLMAIKGQIYDVQSRMFYGPAGPYALFAGKDASRALAKMSFEPDDLTGDISGLGSSELDTLQDWEYKFMAKYAKVGTIKNTEPVTDASSSDHIITSSKIIDAANPIAEVTETAELRDPSPVNHDSVTVDPEQHSELKEDVGQVVDKKE